jgi:hypothetical protein
MKTWMPLIATAVLLTGCVSTTTKTIDAQALSAVRKQSVVHTTRNMPDFSEMTPAKVPFGLIGAALMISEGNKTVASNKVADPANAIAGALLNAMQSAQGMQVVASPVRIDSEDPARIAELAKGKARFVLDVRTLVWQMLYFPTDWTHYRVFYTAKARLIDVDTRAVVAEAFCKQLPDSNVNAPTFDEMLALNAARLKAINAAHAQACAESLGRDMLALQGPVRMPSAALAVTAPVSVQASMPVQAAVPAQAPTSVQVPTPAQVQMPAQAPMPVQAQARASAESRWQGLMVCSARADRGARPEAYEARFAVEISGSMVSVHRRTAEVVESLSGLAANGRLELQGAGHRLADPARPWRLEIGGDFPLGTTSYQGKGRMSVGGHPIRKCELNLIQA